MKRIACILLAIILCLILPLSAMAAPTSTSKVTISYSAKMVSNDHVGNSWTTYIEVRDATIKKGKSAKFEVASADTIKIYCTAIENDKIPDEGSVVIEVPKRIAGLPCGGKR